MTSAGPATRLRRLGRVRLLLLVRAAALLTIASAAVALLPFRITIRFGSTALGERNWQADDCLWAVEAAAKRLPWRTVCIEKGLALQRLLRGAGLAAILHYGVRHHPRTNALEAHVWVTVDARALIGGEEAEGFAEVAAFPA